MSNTNNPNQYTFPGVFKNAVTGAITMHQLGRVGEVWHAEAKNVHVELVTPKRRQWSKHL
jgi:hypothetical protein